VYPGSLEFFLDWTVPITRTTAPTLKRCGGFMGSGEGGFTEGRDGQVGKFFLIVSWHSKTLVPSSTGELHGEPIRDTHFDVHEVLLK
jgi:hypothetical protein